MLRVLKSEDAQSARRAVSHGAEPRRVHADQMDPKRMPSIEYHSLVLFSRVCQCEVQLAICCDKTPIQTKQQV